MMKTLFYNKVLRITLLAMALNGALAATTGSVARAQCAMENTAFNGGEFLSYDLYFNWKFVWVKVGSASMSTAKTTYKGKSAYRASLITRGNNKLDNVFMMRDTLLCYTDLGLSPLYHRKGAREGKRYYVDELWYSYPKGGCHVKMHRLNHHGEHEWREADYKDCIYDMMSIFLRARNFDPSGWKKGERIDLPISDARKLNNTWLTYRGKETFKVDATGEQFQCLVLSFYEREDGKDHELIRFYVTDDRNHIPVRLDMFLSFGSAKAFLKSYKGIRSPLTSKMD